MMFKDELDNRLLYINSVIKEFLPESDNELYKKIIDAACYSVEAGGKRIRPMIMLETYRLCGGKDEEIVKPFMAALEYIHTYSLVHDDLPAMDNDDYRRGRLTTHKVFGEDFGILAGDALLNYAYEVMTSAVCAASPENMKNCAGAAAVIARKAGIFGMVGTTYFGMSPEYINNFVLLAMAGYFTAIVRAPITGIILIFEMTGSLSQMLSLSVVSIVAYVVASLMKSEPIYESLLGRLLKNRGEEQVKTTGQKILSEHVIMHGSLLVHKAVAQIDWPKHCLLVAIKRGEKEIIPKGGTILSASDVIVTINDERDFSYVHEKMEALCAEQIQE